MNFYPIPLIKFAISNPSEFKKFISTIRPKKIFLSLTRVLGRGDLEGGDEAGASLASLILLFLHFWLLFGIGEDASSEPSFYKVEGWPRRRWKEDF